MDSIGSEEMELQDYSKTWRGTVYRFASIDYASKEDLVTGKGAMYHAGRWNPKGRFPAFYTSLTPETALAET